MITSDNGLLMDQQKLSVLGYLFCFNGQGTFSPDGKVEISPEQADKHNKCLSMLEIQSLDKCCEIGQKGTFYFIKGKVTTWSGELVSEQVKVKGKSITFVRNGKVYAGILQKNADCFNFKRTL